MWNSLGFTIRRYNCVVTVFVWMAAVFLLVGCGAGKPTGVAKKYFAALEEGKWEQAQDYVAVSSFGLFEELKPHLQAGNEYRIKGYEMVDDDHAVVQYTENRSTEIRHLHMKKERGRWRVQLGDK